MLHLRRNRVMIIIVWYESFGPRLLGKNSLKHCKFSDTSRVASYENTQQRTKIIGITFTFNTDTPITTKR